MDAERFDRLARALSRRAGRRALLAAIAVSLAPAAVRRADARAARGPGCVPDCTGRDCGDDGCGGSCGTCAEGTVCLEDIGYCVLDPSDCSPPGGPCDGIRCCDLLECVGGVCMLPVCVPVGSVCGPGVTCCEGGECLDGFCEPVAPTCAPTGGNCASVECCEATDTCIVGDDGSLTCTPVPPFDPGCYAAGARLAEAGAHCCPRLHPERGRCVINRWDRCDNRKNRRRQWCEHGARCRGGRQSPNGVPVCVPRP